VISQLSLRIERRMYSQKHMTVLTPHIYDSTCYSGSDLCCVRSKVWMSVVRKVSLVNGILYTD